MPWIRATTAQLSQLRSSGLRWSKVPNHDLPFMAFSENTSIKIAIDFIRPEAIVSVADANTWAFIAGSVAIRVAVSTTAPQIATLGWFHSY